LSLDPFAGIDDHDGGVDGGEHAVGVLGEVFVTRGVEQVHAKSLYSNWSTVELTEMPRCFSSSIQSEVVARWFLRAVTEPASATAPP
jgi:hypothetical protein